jgi:MFS family permease
MAGRDARGFRHVRFPAQPLRRSLIYVSYISDIDFRRSSESAPRGRSVPLMSYLIPLVLFVALILAAALHGLAVSGHFPRRRKEAAFEAVILFGSMALVVLTLVGGIAAALRFVPWYAAIIGGGFALLVAPLVLRWFPDRFVDDRGAPIAFAGTTTALALLLIWLVVGSCRAAGPEVGNWRPDDKTADLFRHSTFL